MDKNSVNLKHLYNPAKYGLDTIHENILEGWAQQEEHEIQNKKLTTFFNSCSLKDAIFVLIKAYKDTYPSSSIGIIHNDSTTIRTGVKKRPDLDIDWEYTPKKGISSIVIKFKQGEEISSVKTMIENALGSKEFTFLDAVFKVKKSPIDTISFTTSKIEIDIHPSKMIDY